MSDIFTDLINWLEALPPFWAYATIFIIAYGENIVPPIPGDMIVVFGGYLVGLGNLSFVMVVALSTIGGALGFMSLYCVGYQIGDAVLEPGRLKWIPKKQVIKAQKWLTRWGYGVVAFNRFLSGFRSVISLTVGMAKMNGWKTIIFATLSAVVWTGLIAYAGFAIGDNWKIVGDYLRNYGKTIFWGLMLLIVFQAVRLYLKRRRKLTKEKTDKHPAS